MWNNGLLRSLAGILVIVSAPTAGRAQVAFEVSGKDRIAVIIDGRPFSTFYIGTEYSKPFLWPLRTAAGLMVTRKFPMENAEGESNDHPHHRGLWIGYGNVNGVNFWENDLESKTSAGNPSVKGTVVLKSLGEVKPGEKSGHIAAVFEWKAEGRTMLEERRLMTFTADSKVRIVDVDATLTADRDVKFADTKEGFFAIRLADGMAERNGGLITNSEGAQTEKNVWGKRAEWVDYDGTIDGTKVGVVILAHPENFNYPPRWHSRAYGLFAVNPFGVKDFDPRSSERGGRLMKAGDSLRFRYRVIVHPGDMTKKKMQDWFGDYVKKVKS